MGRSQYVMVKRMLSASEEETEAALTKRLSEEMQYVLAVLAAARVVIAEVAGHFDGEDPCGRDLTEGLAALERGVASLREEASPLLPAFEPPETSSTWVQRLRQIVTGETEDEAWNDW